jgi:hypothetical protein
MTRSAMSGRKMLSTEKSFLTKRIFLTTAGYQPRESRATKGEKEERVKKNNRSLLSFRRKKSREGNQRKKKDYLSPSKSSHPTDSKTCYHKCRCPVASSCRKRLKDVKLLTCSKWMRSVPFVKKGSSSWSRTCLVRCQSSIKFSMTIRNTAPRRSTRREFDCLCIMIIHIIAYNLKLI